MENSIFNRFYLVPIFLFVLWGIYLHFGHYIKGIKIGKLDINTWTRRDYMDWYHDIVLEAKIKKEVYIIFRGTMQWTKALYGNDEFTSIKR